MSKSPKKLRAMARQVRAAAEKEPNPKIRDAMSLIADGYEKVARQREEEERSTKQ
jgi:hypothetical protein